GRPGPGAPRGPSASRAGLSLVPRHLAPGQALRPGAARSGLRPGRRRRGPLLSPRRLDPQARPRPARTARGRAAAYPHPRPRTRAGPGLLPVKGAPMLTAPTLEKLHALKLTAMAAAWTEQQHQADMTALAFDERFGLLVEAEWLAREDKRLARALQEAKLKLSQACIDALAHPELRVLRAGQYGTRPVTIARQRPPGQRHHDLADATLADAISDRLLHNAQRIVLQGPARRKETTLDS